MTAPAVDYFLFEFAGFLIQLTDESLIRRLCCVTILEIDGAKCLTRETKVISGKDPC